MTTLREAAWEAVEWLEARPDMTEGDAAVSSRLRVALAGSIPEPLPPCAVSWHRTDDGRGQVAVAEVPIGPPIGLDDIPAVTAWLATGALGALLTAGADARGAEGRD